MKSCFVIPEASRSEWGVTRMKVSQMETVCTKNTRTPKLPRTPEQPKNPVGVGVRVWAGVTLILTPTLAGFFGCCGVSVFRCWGVPGLSTCRWKQTLSLTKIPKGRLRNLRKPKDEWSPLFLMHQSIPATPCSTTGNCGAFAGGWA